MSMTTNDIKDVPAQPNSEDDDQADILMDHSYDGIQEYDNPLPGWWSWLFIGSFIFACLYWAYFEWGIEGRTIFDDYDREAAKIFELRFEEIGELEPDQETILKYMKDDKWLTVGQVIYKANCVSCHGAEGQGAVGPNLTDDHWKNVVKIEDIARVIQDGAANGSMPAWRNRLSHINQVVLTAAYVASLRGNNLDGPRPAEGNLIPPWPEQ